MLMPFLVSVFICVRYYRATLVHKETAYVMCSDNIIIMFGRRQCCYTGQELYPYQGRIRFLHSQFIALLVILSTSCHLYHMNRCKKLFSYLNESKADLECVYYFHILRVIIV